MILLFKKKKLYLPAEIDVSPKYDSKKAIEHISDRNRNTLKHIELSLGNWMDNQEFIKIIHALREKGWFDWQILLAIMNFILSTKVNAYVASLGVKTKEETKHEFEKEFQRLMKLHEKDCYMEIPIEELRKDNFLFFLDKLPVDVLNSFDLENNMQFPNFDAVHEFLNRRFNFDKDDFAENNPLKDI